MNNILVPRYLCIGDSKRHDLPPCFAHARAHWIFINTTWSLHVPTIQIHRHAESSHPGKCDSIGFPPCWNSILFENSLLEYKYSSFSAKSISLLPNNQPNIPHLLPIPNNIPNLKNQTSLEHTTTQEQKKMCDWDEFQFVCSHKKYKLLSYCHFARTDPYHQCFGVKVIKNTWIQNVACDPCLEAMRVAAEKNAAQGRR